MKAVVLAAGLGSRLGAPTHKALVETAPGETLLSRQLAALAGAVGRENIVLALGHRAEELKRAAPGLHSVVNERFASTNTARTLELGLRGLDDDVLWLNGDLYFDPPRLVDRLLLRPLASRVLFSRGPADAESVKVRIGRDGGVEAIGKSAAGADGEAVGMNLVVRADRPALLDALASCSDRDYFEAAMDACVRAGTARFEAVDAGEAFCREVDFAADLEAVRALRAGAGGLR